MLWSGRWSKGPGRTTGPTGLCGTSGRHEGTEGYLFDEEELKFRNYEDEVEVPGLEVYGLISVELG
ncbi:MAG TPA: hypothetical protein EYP17_02950 [Candidatus Latescibacteria bacterium]|nr:hypothetical protein [Candidatus Latescibacterota bacterium]